MVKVFTVSALLLALIAGVGWFYQTSKQAIPADTISPDPLSPSPTLADPASVTVIGQAKDSQLITRLPPRQMTDRSDFLKLAAGDQILIKGRSRTNDLEDHIVTIGSASSQSESVLIKGAVTNGGAFIATLGPKSLNIFLQGARQVWRYSGAQFSGELAPLRRANLENDVRIRTPVQLESVDDRAIFGQRALLKS